MSVARAEADSLDAEQLLNAEGEGEFRSARPSWRRAVAGVAVALGIASACAAGVSFHRQRAEELTMARLRKPFTLYQGDLPMPDRADKYDGIPDSRPVTIVDNDGNANVFVIGDWGATLPYHNTFATNGGWDTKAQFSVASAMKNRAGWAKPQYVLNVGDNFYVEGLETSCNAPPDDSQWKTTAAFSSGWQQIYGELANIPWLSVLGNHDYGGWRMDKGWPQQIGYSFINHNWIMPARYFMKRMTHSKFNVDYFMIDSNAYDAKDWGQEPDHNICSQHNYGGAGTCAANGGMPNIAGCQGWFKASYKVQKGWLEEKLAASDADWKIVVTHFPCGYDGAYYKGLKQKYGLDLLVTGHRHQQELWWPGTHSKYIRSFMQANGWDESAPTCFVTGGGGGIVSQKFNYADYGRDLIWYGFFHLTFNKYWMNIELVDLDGSVKGNYSISPQAKKPAVSPEAAQDEDSSEDKAPAKVSSEEKAAPAKVSNEDQETKTKVSNEEPACKSFCGDANNPWSKVCGWKSCGTCGKCKASLLDSMLNVTVEQECKSFCGDANNPWSKVCDWRSCSACDTCKASILDLILNVTAERACKPFCGDINNPSSEVCGWMPCSLCDDCKQDVNPTKREMRFQ